jgi:predicted nucleic acid-binding Zn ribbon protein
LSGGSAGNNLRPGIWFSSRQKMTHVKCNACGTKQSGAEIHCRKCGAPLPNRQRNLFGDILWFGAVLTLLIWLVKFR